MPARPSARRRMPYSFTCSDMREPSGFGNTYSEGDASMAARR
ncbi:MAG TPA: hypothetical protein VIG99_27845 [Myxococcaceae bacterium]